MDRYNIKAILKFALPLVLSSLSMNLMVSMDRLVLTRYSLDAMNGATVAGLGVSLLSFVLISICQIASVFVGQYNGSGEFHKTSQPTWQMIFLSLLSFIVFIPLSIYTEQLNVIPEYFQKDGIPYQRILMAFAPLPAIFAALCAFFIGRKKSLIITSVVILGNITNFVLDLALVFGIKGMIPSMGAEGAAIATVTSTLAQITILSIVFLNKHNRQKYGTSNISFVKSLFMKCIYVGVPYSSGKFLNMVAWYLMVLFFSHTSKGLSTVVSTEFMFFLLFIFVANSCETALSSLSSNLIGENNLAGIQRLLRIFLMFNVIAAILFAFPLLWRHDWLYRFVDIPQNELSILKPEFEFIFYSMWFTIVGDNFFYTISGILTAGGDTKYPMYLEVGAAWLGATIPTMIMYYTGTLTSVKIVYTLIPISSLINGFLIYRRYTALKWFNKLV